MTAVLARQTLITSGHAVLETLRLIIVAIATFGLVGCQAWQTTPSPTGADRQSLLKPVSMGEDGFRLEIITVRFPHGDAEMNTSAWTQIDEQSIPSETRRCLSDNGLRAGTIVGQLPPEIERVLVAVEQPATITEAASNFAQGPVVSRQHMQLHSGWRGQLVASRLYDDIPLLLPERKGESLDVTGQPFRLAQGILDVSAVATGDRRVKLHVTPELHHGEPRQTFATDMIDGQLRPQPSKQKKVFNPLAFDAVLASEQMLVLTSLPDRPGTLGHYFFTEKQADQMQQKMMIIRLEHARFSDLFSDQKIAGDLPEFK